MNKDSAFENNVFINCPFDDEFKPLLKTLLFIVPYLNLNPQIASERLTTTEIRLEKIKKMIKSSKYGIHDLSRAKAKKKNDMARFNMPFELGIDYGCKIYSTNFLKTKEILIIDDISYDYQKKLSDISGFDIQYHNNKEKNLIRAIRNWFQQFSEIPLKSPSFIYNRYLEFKISFEATLKEEQWTEDDIAEMMVSDYIRYVRKWISDNNTPS